MSYVGGGCSTYSKQSNRFPANYPQGLMMGNGCKVRGVDGKTYIDLISGLGAIFLGYQDEAVDRAVLKQLRAGTLFSLPHPLEEEVAEKFCRLTGWEQVRWCKNGSDATEAAVRLARYITRRELVITFGGYHGFHSDLVASTPGKSGGILDYSCGALASLDPTAGDFFGELVRLAPLAACVIAEPIGFASLPWGQITKVIQEAGCLLIFDEVITGLRYGHGSALPEIRPDLTCYGKALGNGYPIAAIAGPRAWMQEFEDHVFFSGTYAAECLSLAAAGAVLDRIETDSGLYERMAEVGMLLKGGFNELAAHAGVAAICRGLPPRTQFRFANPAHFDIFRAGMADRGVLLGQDNFITAAHTVPMMESVLEACRGALLTLKEKCDG